MPFHDYNPKQTRVAQKCGSFFNDSRCRQIVFGKWCPKKFTATPSPDGRAKVTATPVGTTRLEPRERQMLVVFAHTGHSAWCWLPNPTRTSGEADSSGVCAHRSQRLELAA